MNNTKSKQNSVQINSSIIINASKEAVFNAVSNHEGTPTWVDDVKSVELLKEGTPKNGLGAIRKVNFKPIFWSTIEEKIILYSQNEEYHYQIIKMPGVSDHLGIWKVLENSRGETTVKWNVYMEYKQFHWIRLIIKRFAADFKTLQEEALIKLKTILEEKT